MFLIALILIVTEIVVTRSFSMNVAIYLVRSDPITLIAGSDTKLCLQPDSNSYQNYEDRLRPFTTAFGKINPPLLCVQEVVTHFYAISYYIKMGNYFLDT